MNESPLLWAVIRSAARFVPFGRRAEWLAEWQSELWYAIRSRKRGRLETLGFALGAFNDALWIWRRGANLSSDLWLRSPRSCLTFLLGLAALCVGLFFYAEPVGQPAIIALLPNRRIAMWMIVQTFCALLILPAVTTMSLGRTFQLARSPARKTSGRTRVFTTLKLALVLVIAFFGALEFAPPSLQPQATLVGCVFGFRWVLRDYRMRCPICLRRLVRGRRVGSASGTFLGHYGTELCCDKGHGVMCEPDAVTNYTAQRWSDSGGSPLQKI